jgi:EAL domain-containing protein (putative c-di-GMP-specific phosphodiesterase class I)
MQIGVNLSSVQLRKGAIYKVVSEVLSATGFEAQYLELELTESTLMQDTEDVVMALSKLRDMGVRLSIDDFGTGYSSLSYLKRFPLNTLKIDRAFLRDIETDPADAAIVRAIIAMAKSLELGVIAEGVETQQQCQFLIDEGCEVVQGYLFSKPLPADECELLLRKSKIAALL